MSNVKPKKQSTFIDMTAMSDVTVLLLTFFMLTATFLPKEPIRVVTPASVMEIKIPDANLLTILIKPNGQCYLNLDRPIDRKNVLELVSKERNITFTPQQINSFVNQPSIGVPLNILPEFLEMKLEDQDAILKDSGIPTDSTNNQLKMWIQYTCMVNTDLKIAIKADQSTPYPMVKNVIETLQDLKQNRFN
ncbi:MAG: biopolymer transporter ExbD, partial [Bacteroidales bacterium]